MPDDWTAPNIDAYGEEIIDPEIVAIQVASATDVLTDDIPVINGGVLINN